MEAKNTIGVLQILVIQRNSKIIAEERHVTMRMEGDNCLPASVCNQIIAGECAVCRRRIEGEGLVQAVSLLIRVIW